MPASPDSLGYLRDLVHRRSAIVITADKDYLLESRLGPLAKSSGVEDVEALVGKLRAEETGDPSAPLAVAVVEAMTTNETSFFRDAHPFEALKKEMIPRLIEQRRDTRTLRVWCAAASTGQEPYSVAILLRESFPELASWRVQIIATDLNRAVISRARSGRFSQLEVNRGLPAALLVKYFTRVGAGWDVKSEIRDMVSFQQLNLLDRWPIFAPQDVIFLRNVLIYFDVPTRRRLLGRVRDELRPDGYLILGGAETTLGIDDGFSAVRIGSAVYHQRTAPQEGKLAHVAR